MPAYLHVDAALFGGYLPFTPHAERGFAVGPRRDGIGPI